MGIARRANLGTLEINFDQILYVTYDDSDQVANVYFSDSSMLSFTGTDYTAFKELQKVYRQNAELAVAVAEAATNTNGVLADL